MAEFARIIRTLQRLFPQSGTGGHKITELSGSVVPTFEFPPRIVSIERERGTIFNSSLALTPLLFIGVQEQQTEPTLIGGVVSTRTQGEYYAEITGGDISHDSATPRNLQLHLRSPDNQTFFFARWLGIEAVLAAGKPSGFEPIFGAPGTLDRINASRPVLIPPGWQLVLSADAAAAAYVVTVALRFIVHPLSEAPAYT